MEFNDYQDIDLKLNALCNRIWNAAEGDESLILDKIEVKLLTFICDIQTRKEEHIFGQKSEEYLDLDQF